MLARLDDVIGALYAVATGINKGNPLSPLSGAIYLSAMDRQIEGYCQKRELKYYRYMDDWVILCQIRYQLREIVKIMNQCLHDVKQRKHPFKTYIGRIKSEGFDFLGYRIQANRSNTLVLAWKTSANHLGKIKQLYEQGGWQKPIAKYIKHWLARARGGIGLDCKSLLNLITHSVDKALWKYYLN